MEIRNFEIRSVDPQERTVEGIAVPYGIDTNVGGYTERIERGAFGKPTDVKLFAQHQEPIGLVTEARDTDEGLIIKARISDTQRGNEVYTLLRDGVLNKFSVGFVPVEHRMDGETVVRTKAELKEVSVVAFPAYDGADVLSVRQEAEVTASDNTLIEENKMSEDTIAPEVAELREAVTDLERKVAVMGDTTSTSSLPVFRSYGDYVKAYAQGDDHAMTLQRAFTDTSDSVIKDAWVSDVLRFVDHGRPSLNAFSKAALPSSGNNVEYAKINANTVATGVQAVQGDALTYGEISLTSATAAVKTYGGYVSMSRQAIERSSVNYLDAAFRAMALGYAKATNTAFVAAVVAAAGGANTADATTGGSVTSANLIGAVTEASVEIWNDTALNAEFILVSKDVFQVLVTKVDGSGRPLVAFANPSNNIGSANVPGIQASFMGLPVIVDPSLAAGTMYVANSNAVVTYESAGAPLRLSDSNIVNLTNDFSVYGYAAFAVEQVKGICVVDVTV